MPLYAEEPLERSSPRIVSLDLSANAFGQKAKKRPCMMWPVSSSHDAAMLVANLECWDWLTGAASDVRRLSLVETWLQNWTPFSCVFCYLKILLVAEAKCKLQMI